MACKSSIYTPFSFVKLFKLLLYNSVIFRNFASYLRHDTKVAIVYTNLYLDSDRN